MKERKVTQKGKTLDIVINVVLVIVMLIIIGFSFTAYATTSGSGIPNILGYMPLAVQTDSMEPEFSAGDLIIDKVVDASELEVGDVITFWTVIEGQQVLNSHRIVEITDYDTYLYFDTKGDNNTIEDASGVHQSEVVGIYLFSIPNLGTVIDFLQTGMGFFIAVVIPVFLFFIYQVVTFFKALFAYQKEKMRLQVEEEKKKTVEASETKEENTDEKLE